MPIVEVLRGDSSSGARVKAALRLGTASLLALGALLLPVREGHAATDPFAGCVVRGLVGAGIVPADTLDATGQDTLGGVFSGMALNLGSVKREGAVYSGALYGLADRGFGDGATDFRPRLQTFTFRFTPDLQASAAHPAEPVQLVLNNTATLKFSDAAGREFTGLIPDAQQEAEPTSATSGIGVGRRSLDPEGLALAGDGGWWVSEEYGPFVYRFDATGKSMATLRPPDAILPRSGEGEARRVDFATQTPSSGRRANHGLEGLTRTPDGGRLVAVVQGPLAQDGGKKAARCTRLLVWDLAVEEQGVPKLSAEYVCELPVDGRKKGRATDANELLAIDSERFLILVRDASGRGGTPGAMRYKKVNLIDLRGATNILGSAYDLPVGAPGHEALPLSRPQASGVVPVKMREFVDLLDRGELAKFGLNAGPENNARTLSEKWEGLALLPAGEMGAPHDYFLFVGNDNDFKAHTIRHNGAPVGGNQEAVDTVVLVWRVTLPPR